MRAGLLTGAVLCSCALLLGLAPLPVYAADPPSPGEASTAPAASASGTQGASVSQDKSAPQVTSTGQDASSRQTASDRPRRETPRARGQRVPASAALDLTTPPITRVMTPEQVQALIGEPDDAEPEEVMVERGRYQEPVPEGQIQALAWALMHPLEAWRIFTPVTDQ